MSQTDEIKMGRALTNAVDNESLARHRWYPIKEGFSATLISDSLKELDADQRKTALAIEPFSGSGTTPVECSRLNVDCLAFEVNPFLAFVGRTKLRSGDRNRLHVEREAVLKGLEKPVVSPLEGWSTFCEGKGKKKWLFNRNVLRSFTGGWQAVADCNHYYRSFLRLALVRAAMENCNAYPDGKCLRYKRLKNYDCFNPEQMVARFEHYCGMIEQDLEKEPLAGGLSRVECRDSRALETFEQKRRFDFCVTSPPYLNSFDYSDVYRPELFLTGVVGDNDQLMRIRMRTVRSHIQADWTPPQKDSFGSLYAKAIKELQAKQGDLWSPRILEMVQAYFEDMERLLSALAIRANPNALLKVVVATSAYCGVVIPVDFILAEIAEKAGWVIKDVKVVRRLRSSAQNWKHESLANGVPALRESIVVLRSPKK
jgi:DNA modification methylase